MRDPTIKIRLPDTVMDDIRDRARENQLSIYDYVRHLIIEATGKGNHEQQDPRK